MNENNIEQLLRKAPAVQPPVGLLETLQREIELPHAGSRMTNDESPITSGWLRRWLPAVGFALLFFGCVVVFGIQANWINELREQKRALESASATAAQRALTVEASRVALTAELERLKKVWRTYSDCARRSNNCAPTCSNSRPCAPRTCSFARN
jgi:hypothetical protein